VEGTRQGLASSSRIATSGQAHALVNETRPQLNAVASPTHLRLRHASLEVPSARRGSHSGAYRVVSHARPRDVLHLNIGLAVTSSRPASPVW
jgi:hypothetical protein